MEKKINQISRVIQHLNAKGDDTDVAETASTYENEIEGILRDAADRVKRFHAAAQYRADSTALEARAEEIARRLETVDLANELEAAFVAVQPGLEAKELTLTTAVEPGLSPTISSVAALVERIVSNLARNVVAHATYGSAVTCAIRADGTERVAITVSNDCAPLPPETSERAFEAFWRADMARAGEGEHVGLGLALVAKATETLGGTSSIDVEAVGEASARFSVTVTLPRSASS